jgi:ABC-2 type transport system permease protein
MKDLLLVLKYKIILFMKTNTPLTFASIAKSIGISIIYSAFAVGFFIFTKSTIRYLIDVTAIGSFLLHRFIMVILFMFFVSINIGNIVVSYSTLFKSGETAWFFTKPVSFSKVFLIKFLDNFFYSSTTLLLIVSAALLGYGVYFKLEWYFYPFALFIVILPFMFSAGSLGAILLLIILRLSGRYGLKKVIGTLGVIYASWIIGFYFLSSPIDLVRKVFAYFHHVNLNQYFGFLENPFIKYMPNSWVADSFYWITQGQFHRAEPLIILNLLFSVMLFGLSMFIAKKWYYKTWLISLELNTFSKLRSSPDAGIFSFNNKSSLKSLDEVMFKREFHLFFREPGQWVHLCVMLFLMGIFISGISGIKILLVENYYNDYLKTIIYLVVSLFSIFMVAALSLRFVFPLISLEGETIWKIRSSPINYRPFLVKRLLVYFAVILILGQLITFFANIQFPGPISVIGQINSAFIIITIVSLNFGMGGYFSNYKEKNPIRIASSQGASITFLFILIYLVFLIALLFIPIFNFFKSSHIFFNAPLNGLIITSIVLFISTAVIAVSFIHIGFKSFCRDI